MHRQDLTDASFGSRLFRPILAGATLRGRALACLGAIVGIALTGLVAALVTGYGALLPLIVAPIGASAVLVFAVPASPLAQPWPVVGGNTLSRWSASPSPASSMTPCSPRASRSGSRSP